jgi:4-oxalocrotonate tautomerase family enzyme
MPIITVEGPPVADLSVKRALAEGLTEVAAKAYGMPRETIIVQIRETRADNVAVGGQLICDR